MKVTILRSGKYADLKGVVRAYQTGEVLETKEWYANSIIQSGYAERPAVVDPAHVAAEIAHEIIAEGAIEEEEPQTKENWTRLPGVTRKIDAALHEAGIDTQEQILAAIANGSLVNIVGLTRFARIKAFYEAM